VDANMKKDRPSSSLYLVEGKLKLFYSSIRKFGTLKRSVIDVALQLIAM
jgi:hypothetical protein